MGSVRLIGRGALVLAMFLTAGCGGGSGAPGTGGTGNSEVSVDVAGGTGLRTPTITAPASATDEVTYDLDGLTLAESDAMNVGTWPSGWADVVPQPDGCTLDGRMGVMEASDAGFHVGCTYASEDPSARAAALDAYIALLLSRGFAVSETSTDGYSCHLWRDGVTVSIYSDTVGKMDIQATKDS